MELRLKKTILGAAATVAIYAGAVASVASLAVSAQRPATLAARATPARQPAAPAQAVAQRRPAAAPVWRVGTSQRPVMAEQLFTNITDLKGITATELMETMGFFSAALNETCTYCHTEESGGSWPRYADDGNPLKNTTRRMIRMVNNINRINFGGAQLVTCFTCHQAAEQPKSTPTLAEQYEPPANFEPDAIASQNPNAPPPDQLIDKYIQAIGGAARVAGVTSVAAKGAFESYTAILRGTAEFYAKAPNQRTIIFHTASGEHTIASNGTEVWQAGPEDTTPFPLIALSGAALEGMLTDAKLFFPTQIKQTLTRWRTGTPIMIDGREVQVVQGSMPSGGPVKLYFDSETGLLVRQVRYIKTIVGMNPYQIDYSNYKELSGVKLPSQIVITFVDGFYKMNFDDVQVNVPVDPAKFSQPAAPTFRDRSQG